MASLLVLVRILCVAMQLLLGFFELAMLLRCILSLFNPEEEGVLAAILFTVTEPAIMPVRALLEKLRIGEGLPIDISFLVTVVLISLFSMLLPSISLSVF